jgi:hypothetical protein
LAKYAFPLIGAKPVAEVDVQAVTSILDPVWSEKPETASRLRGRIENILDWATVRGMRTDDNPARWRGHLQGDSLRLRQCVAFRPDAKGAKTKAR